uniref:ABC-type quaternary amine transporter n=1 Tax=Caldilinea aerophila TaxID=133453 RepID=A0A7C1JYH3_9CHLR
MRNNGRVSTPSAVATPVTEHALSLTNVSKRFGDVVALEDLSLEVAPGELLAMVGPSGCGKTTVLRLVAGLESPDSGRIEIWGQIVVDKNTHLSPETRKVGLVFQDYALFPHMTVSENVGFGLHNWDHKTRTRRIAEVLELVQLGHLADRYPNELSGGEQQRVALARALAPQPKVLLLDEPFSNLDAALRAQMREEVRNILKAVHTTALFVTHDQEEAMFMGDRVAVLNAGRLEQITTPDEIFTAPASRFVAEFLGPTDFLPGKITHEGVHTEIGLLIQPVDLPVDTPVEVALRPDDITLVPDPTSEARVLTRYFRGTMNVYRVRLPSGRIVHSLQAHTLNLTPGTPVRVQMEPGHALACFALPTKHTAATSPHLL